MVERLLEIASAARAFMEPEWRAWWRDAGVECPHPASRSTCGRSSLFMVRALRREGHDARWANGIPRVSAESPDLGPFGFHTGARWESHAWVEVGGWIVDITADQFGAPPVVVVPATDPRYGRLTLDTASPESIERRARQVDEIWSFWIAARLAIGPRPTQRAF